ncbi:MAG: hypothetical protein K8F92_13890 [Hyphomicrobium sp.]|uniref:hypothetical protein n=1 Tax=Hyphomicrobium sp. TaxID=82 RepID=UPI0013243FFD|nr:hypothetical protein [Hyphomicrobium sp.]KAB2943486.1 MAG: hypothetical protein F9K20_02010 [Hyphomicrobium sp.]MBZ0210733.1 hypothetical protein [Hyphomicrobium sp.]
MLHGDRRMVFESGSTDALQRAYDGACWTAGIHTRPHASDTSAIAAPRDALTQAVVKFASTGVGDVQELKARALKSVFDKSLVFLRCRADGQH